MATKPFLMLLLSFSALLAGTTPFGAVDDYYNIWSSFEPYMDAYNQSGPDSPSEERLKGRLESIYRKCMTGRILDEYVGFLRQTTFHCGAAAYFYPIAPTKVLSKNVVRNDGQTAVVEYAIQSVDSWGSMENFSISKHDDWQLRWIYKEYRVSSPLFESLKQRLLSCFKVVDIGDKKIEMPCEYNLTVKGRSTATFTLKKVEGQWKVSGLQEVFQSSTLSVQMD